MSVCLTYLFRLRDRTSVIEMLIRRKKRLPYTIGKVSHCRFHLSLSTDIWKNIRQHMPSLLCQYTPELALASPVKSSASLAQTRNAHVFYVRIGVSICWRVASRGNRGFQLNKYRRELRLYFLLDRTIFMWNVHPEISEKFRVFHEKNLASFIHIERYKCFLSKEDVISHLKYLSFFCPMLFKSLTRTLWL